MQSLQTKINRAKRLFLWEGEMKKRIMNPLSLSIAAELFGRGKAWEMQLEGAVDVEPVVLECLALAGSDGGYEFEGRAVAIDRPVIGYVSPTYTSWVEIR